MGVPGGSAVKVDGFENGQMPRKKPFRRVASTNNPYSGGTKRYNVGRGMESRFSQARFGKSGQGQPELSILTDESLNSRKNPFAFVRAAAFAGRGASNGF